MMIAGILLAVAVEGGIDTCQEVVELPDEHPDVAGAAVYRAVGDDESKAGHADAARVAYREALRRDPHDAGARAALATLCQAEREPSAPRPELVSGGASERFDEGLALMKRGDRTGAIAAFEAARAQGDDPGAALLQGICEYERGEDERARPLLEEARNAPSLAGTATLFLGLIALREDQNRLASSLFDAASSDPRLAATASGLARLARRDGRVVASALAEGGYDSNVSLAPDGTPTQTGAGDGYAAAVAGLFLRPFGTTGPYARLTGQYRKQAQITSYDLGDAGGAIGGQLGGGGRYLAAEYGYDFLTLGGAPYLSAHRLLATGRAATGRVALDGTYAARFESFLTSGTAQYSGLRHDADLAAECLPSATTIIGLGYHVGADGTQSPSLSYLEHGPLALLRLGVGRQIRLVTEARVTFRRYDAMDPDLGARADRYLDGALAWELDTSDHWTVRVTATGRRATSNVPDLQYTKLTAGLGLVYTAGVR
jgi:tetratricopeptide (TPR) repeat protein